MHQPDQPRACRARGSCAPRAASRTRAAPRCRPRPPAPGSRSAGGSPGSASWRSGEVAEHPGAGARGQLRLLRIFLLRGAGVSRRAVRRRLRERAITLSASSSSRKFMRRCGGSRSSRKAVARHLHAAGAPQGVGELRMQRAAPAIEQWQRLARPRPARARSARAGSWAASAPAPRSSRPASPGTSHSNDSSGSWFKHLQRHQRRYAVVLMAGLEAVAQLHDQRTRREMIGKTRGIQLGVARRDVALGEPQQLRILRLGLAAPLLEGRAG